jgi:hypothetical protein
VTYCALRDQLLPMIDVRPKVTWGLSLQAHVLPDGSVRVTAGRCRDCRHWTAGKIATSGICAELSYDGEQPVSDNEAWTDAVFGCVLWERKREG